MAIAFYGSTSIPDQFNSTSTSNFDAGSGTDRFLVVGVGINNTNSFPSTIVQYNGINMTSLGTQSVGNGDPRTCALWYLPNPTAGINTLFITMGAAVRFTVFAAAYSGVPSTYRVKSLAFQNPGGTTTSFDMTMFVPSSTGWAFGIATDTNGSPSASSGTQRNVESDANFGGTQYLDSNGVVTGTTTLGSTTGGNSNWGGIMGVIAPPFATSQFFFFMRKT